VKSILEAPTRLYGYILPTLLVYGSLGYIAYFFGLSEETVKEFLVSLMRL